MSEQSFETIVEVCCHRVQIRYWGFKTPLTDEVEQRLEEEGEQRAKQMICEGFYSGELNCLYVDDDVDDDGKEEEIRGWWEIE